MAGSQASGMVKSHMAQGTSLPSIPHARHFTKLDPKTDSVAVPELTMAQRGGACWEDSGVDLSARKLFHSERNLFSLTTDDRRIVSPRPPSPCRRKNTDVVRTSKAELERRDAAARQLTEDNTRLSSRVRRLEQDLRALHQVEEDYRAVGAQVGVALDSVSTETARAAIAVAVTDVVKEREKAQQRLSDVNDQVTALSGTLAAERTKGEVASAELDQLRKERKEKDSIMKQQQEDLQALRQSSASLSAQLESLRHRMASAEEAGGSAPCSVPVALQELTKLQEEVARGALEVGDLGDRLRAQEEQLELAVDRAAISQDALTELLDSMSEVLGLPVDESTPRDCVRQVVALCQENTDLRAIMSALEEEKAACEAGAKANRETILRMVAEAKAYETTLDKMSTLKQERDTAVACKVSVEHERDELVTHLSRVKEQLAAAESRLQEEGQQAEAVQEELHQLEETLERQKEESSCLMAKIQAVTHCGSSEPIEALQGLAMKADELQSVLGQVSSLESTVKLQTHELDSMRGIIEERDKSIEGSQAELKAAKEQIEACRAEAALMEATVTEVKQALQVHVEFGMRLATCLGLDGTVSELLTGEFACDAVITRAQQLVRQETQALLEKQAMVHRLQQRLKVSRQAVDSKELHITVLQKKIATLQERITSYTSTQSRVDSLEKKLKMRCSQEEKLRAELAHWNTAEQELNEKERCLLQLKDAVKAREATNASLQDTIRQLSKERDAAVKKLDGLHAKDSKQRECLEQCRAELEVELRACQDKLGQLKAIQQQYVSLREGLGQALGMSQGQMGNDQVLIETAAQIYLALQRQEQRSRDLETSLHQLEQGFMLGLRDTLSQLCKPET